LIGRKRASFARHHLREIVARDELHHEKLAVTFREMVTDTRQRRMMQACEQTRLALELFSQALLGKQRLFQSHSRVEPLIDCFVNGTHTTLPELAHDTIPSL